MKAAVAPSGVKFVVQEEQRGTGHALQMVKAYFALTVRRFRSICWCCRAMCR